MYDIVRYYKDNKHPDHMKTIKSGLSLDAAQAHCSDPKTMEKGVWFDSYVERGRRPLKSKYAIPVSKVCGLFKRTGDLLHRVNQ